MRVDYGDNSLRRELEKKWEVVKVIHSRFFAEQPNPIAFHASSQAELTGRLERPRSVLRPFMTTTGWEEIAEEFYKQKFAQYAQEKEEAVAALKRHDAANTRYYELGIMCWIWPTGPKKSI